MSENIKCPLCGENFRSEPLNTWKFRFYKVKRFQCPNCKGKFNFYDSPTSKFFIKH